MIMQGDGSDCSIAMLSGVTISALGEQTGSSCC